MGHDASFNPISKKLHITTMSLVKLNNMLFYAGYSQSLIEVAEVEESGGLGSEISGQIQQNPVEDIPQTNPFEAETNPFGETQANPFEDVYKNPFGQ